MKRFTQHPAGNDSNKVNIVAQHSAGNDSREASRDKPRRAIGYIRVLKDAQASGGMSLDAQQAMISQYCAEHGLRLIRVCRDVASGSKNQRPGLQDALEGLDGGADVLIVLRFDRLSRSMDHLCELYEGYFKDGAKELVEVEGSKQTGTAGDEA
ncbi:MAG: recombinase family protein [Armatimonas sp.]